MYLHLSSEITQCTDIYIYTDNYDFSYYNTLGFIDLISTHDLVVSSIHMLYVMLLTICYPLPYLKESLSTIA